MLRLKFCMVPKKSAVQTNNVDMDSQPGCLGNTTTSTATQLYVGPGEVEQTRSHFVGGRMIELK